VASNAFNVTQTILKPVMGYANHVLDKEQVDEKIHIYFMVLVQELLS
jgi:hypothetical protein